MQKSTLLFATFLLLPVLTISAGTVVPNLKEGSTPEEIVFQGFEGAAGDTWAITAGETLVSSSIGSSDIPVSQRIRTGSYSWQPGQSEYSDESLELAEVDISEYSSITATLHLSATDTESNYGLLAGDSVKVYVALDGASYASAADITIRGVDTDVSGVEGARWAYSATGQAITTAGTARAFQPAGDGNRTTDGYAELVVAIPAGAQNIKMKIATYLQYATELWNIDDITLTGIQDGGASNLPPTLSLDPSVLNKSVLVTNPLTFVASATEPPADTNDTISLWATNLPSGASYPSISGKTPLTNTFYWTPTLSQTGSYAVSFFAGDKDGTNTLSVHISVAEPGTGTYRAVICGISDYEGTANDLNYCDDDAQSIYDTLLASPNWLSGNMQLLLDGQATEANVHSAIQIMGSNALPSDICLFYFSGHGGGDLIDSDGDEGGDGYDEYLCPWAVMTTEISDDELSDWLDALPTDNLIVWLDTCHSGGHLKTLDGLVPKGISRRPERLTREDRTPREQRTINGFASDLQKTMRKRDVNDLASPYISTACDDDEYSYEDGTIGHGVYTLYLLEALTNSDSDVSGWISGEETFSSLYPKVVAYESTQHPQEYDGYPGQADVVKDAGGNQAVITITNPPTASIQVPNDTATYDISGNASTSTVGTIFWTNTLTGGGGSFAATTTWSVTGISLSEGANNISVSGGNSSGDLSSDSVTITRQPAGLLLFENFDADTSVPTGWTDGGTANDTLPVHLSSSPNCRALASGDTLDTPAVDFPTNLSFYADASNSGDGESVTVQYYDGSWNTLGTFNADKNGLIVSFDTDSAPNLTGTSSVKFRWSGPSSGTVYIDDVSVIGVSEAISNAPLVTITNPASGSVPNATITANVQGTANSNVVGLLTWDNSLTAGSGTLAVAEEWTISDISLDVGANVITVTGTNVDGIANSANITVTREAPAGSGGGLETFANYSETGSSYEDGTFTGQDGSTWSYTQCRGDQTISDETPCLGKGRTPTAQMESGNIAGGCGTLSFDIMQAFSTAYELEVYVNDTLYDTIAGGTVGIVDSSGDITVNESGSVVFKFIQPDSGAGQVSIDTITWTGYGGTPSDPDDDSDGMPNWWENMYSAGVTNLDALSDSDSDGQNNLDEWVAYCNPIDSNSFFKVEDSAITPSADAVIIRWASATNRLYDLLWSSALGTSFGNIATNISATPPENTYTDTVHGANALGFYHIKVSLSE